MELVPEMILMDQEYANKEDAIRACGQLLVDAGCVESGYVDAMIERNKLVSVYMGNFIAIPHGTDEAKHYVKKSGISVIQVPTGVRFGKDDTEDVAMVLFGIAGIGNEHLNILQKIAIFCSDVENVVKLADAKTKEEVIGYLQEVE
ncbi:PTS sugar transporter subunit IIA [Enterococcus viikkiensis]|uniref:Mannitol-specific phosphotransferase enzyme IIA component n=1 Tax=Enterococcus viikkiensis TaxID=930854 RepID=A0ABU3FPZ6_9ENTE|nr:PTS sugar transporter subunit IIA [Enterococcus viikkiensis]MDT2828045.1 PTS sugar transporter subunit IIA [Enterococcus viikkiensis]